MDGQPVARSFSPVDTLHDVGASIGAANGENISAVMEPFLGDIAEVLV